MEEEKSTQKLKWTFPLGRIYLTGFWDTTKLELFTPYK